MTQFVLFKNVCCGDHIVADRDFICMEAGPKLVKKDENNELYVDCNDGKHYLDGQLDEKTGELLGFSMEIE